MQINDPLSQLSSLSKSASSKGAAPGGSDFSLKSLLSKMGSGGIVFEMNNLKKFGDPKSPDFDPEKCALALANAKGMMSEQPDLGIFFSASLSKLDSDEIFKQLKASKPDLAASFMQDLSDIQSQAPYNLAKDMMQKS